jgi:hypothetical protein
VPDPETIVAAFHDEFAALAALTEQAHFDEAESPTTLQEMETQLESAMQKIDEMIASKAILRATPERCQALTQIGRQCKNRPLPGSDYCHVHQKESAATL